MPIVRNDPHRKGYTVISNTSIQDTRLSLAAKGLHHFILSFPDDWQVNVRHLAKSCKEGRDKIYKLLSELESFGYLERTQSRTSGKFNQTIFTIYESPLPENTGTAAPLPEKPDTEKPDTEKPDTGNTDAYKVINQPSNELTNYFFDKESEQKNAVTKGTNKGALPSGSTSTENSQANKPLTHCPEKTEAFGVTPTTPGKDQCSAPVRVKKTLGALQGGSNREYQKAMAERAALTLFQSEEEESSFYRWAKGRFYYNGEQQADIAIARLRNKAKATPRDKELLSQFRNSTSAPQQAPELTRGERMALAAEEYKKDPSMLQKDVVTFRRDHGVSLTNFKCYLFKVGLVG